MIRVVDEYSNYIENLKSLIKDSKFKTTHFLEELEIPKASFYRKLRDNTFSVEEVRKITKILYPKESYQLEFIKAIEQGREDIKNGNVISSEEMRKAMKEKIAGYQ